MKISEALKRAREERGLTKQAVADAIGMQRPNYARYELENKENRSPRIEHLIALSEFYGVSLDYLVGRSDDPRLHQLNEDTL